MGGEEVASLRTGTRLEEGEGALAGEADAGRGRVDLGRGGKFWIESDTLESDFLCRLVAEVEVDWLEEVEGIDDMEDDEG